MSLTAAAVYTLIVSAVGDSFTTPPTSGTRTKVSRVVIPHPPSAALRMSKEAWAADHEDPRRLATIII